MGGGQLWWLYLGADVGSVKFWRCGFETVGCGLEGGKEVSTVYTGRMDGIRL